MRKEIAAACLLFIVCFLGNTSYASAEETCSYKTRAELNKIAASVTASYDITTKEDGTTVFKISVYNVTKEIYVSASSEDDDTFSLSITPEISTNGTYTFEVTNTIDIIKYNFVVRSYISGCTGDIRKFSLVKPKKNKYHDYNECKFADTENYTYCKEWITNEITLSESDVINKIAEQRNGKKKITTTKCDGCSTDVRNTAKMERLKLIKKIIVIGISICAALDIIYIYMRVSYIRRSEL